MPDEIAVEVREHRMQNDAHRRTHVPAYGAIVVQDESETAHNPSLDAGSALQQPGSRFRVAAMYNPRPRELAQTVAAGPWDCLVLGYNVLYRQPQLLEALAEVPSHVGLLLLHQLELKGTAAAPLGADLGLCAEQLGERCTGAEPPQGATRRTDQLLAWPEPVGDLEAVAVSAWLPGTGSAWIPVLQVSDHHGVPRPVILRSPLGGGRRVAACSLLLEPRRRDSDAALLGNAVTFCAAGAPEIVIVRSSRTTEASALARNLRLRGVHAVELERRGQPLDFGAWSLRGVAEAVVDDADMERAAGLKAWLADGGQRTTTQVDGGVIVHRAGSDPAWVAELWAVWVMGLPGEPVGEKIMASRATLRFVRALEAHGFDPATVGVDPERWREPLRKLLGQRVTREGHCEHTIGATVAALECDSLLPGVLTGGRRKAVCQWLAKAFETAGPEDRFDISRVLDDPSLVRRIERPDLPSAVALTRSAEAATRWGCAWPWLSEDEHAARHAAVQELARSVLLSAQYLAAVAPLPDRTQHTDELADVAIATLASRGALRHGVPEPALVELVATEARALLQYSSLVPVATRSVRPDAAGIPSALVNDALRRGEQLRAQLVEQSERLRALGRAQHTIAVITIVAVVVAFAAIIWRTEDFVESVQDVVVASAVAIVVCGVALGIERHFGVAPPWAGRLGRALVTMREWLARRFGAQPSKTSPSA